MPNNIERRTAPLEVVLDLEAELEEYNKSRDRTALVSALKDQFLAQRHVSAAETERARRRAAQALLDRIPAMSDNMLLRVVETLARVGEADVQAVLGLAPGGRGPLVALNQVIGGAGQSPVAVSVDHPGENPIRTAGNILEAVQHAVNYLNTQQPSGGEPKLIEGETVEEP
jgi:hypothetical protein